jgi:choline dehydrogenase
VKTDKEIDDWVAGAAESAYHPSCTCPMGSDANAVVDGQTNVHGIDGLNVVDSSIFPTIPSGNLNAPTIMVAEKAADLIAGVQPLAPSNAPVWVCPDWQTRQREHDPERPLDDAPAAAA